MSPGVKHIRSINTALAVLFLLVVSGFLPTWFGSPGGLTGLHHREQCKCFSSQGDLTSRAEHPAIRPADQPEKRSGRCGVSLCNILFEKMTIDEREFATNRPVTQMQYVPLCTPDTRVTGLVAMPGVPVVTTAPKYVLHSTLLV